MRRFLPVFLAAAVVLLGTLPLGGCIVAPHRDRVVHRDNHHGGHHDRGHDHGHHGKSHH